MPVLREVGGFIFILYFVFSLTGILADRQTGRLFFPTLVPHAITIRYYFTFIISLYFEFTKN